MMGKNRVEALDGDCRTLVTKGLIDSWGRERICDGLLQLGVAEEDLPSQVSLDGFRQTEEFQSMYQAWMKRQQIRMWGPEPTVPAEKTTGAVLDQAMVGLLRDLADNTVPPAVKVSLIRALTYQKSEEHRQMAWAAKVANDLEGPSSARSFLEQPDDQQSVKEQTKEAALALMESAHRMVSAQIHRSGSPEEIAASEASERRMAAMKAERRRQKTAETVAKAAYRQVMAQGEAEPQEQQQEPAHGERSDAQQSPLDPANGSELGVTPEAESEQIAVKPSKSQQLTPGGEGQAARQAPPGRIFRNSPSPETRQAARRKRKEKRR